jgi:hypothetical protein
MDRQDKTEEKRERGRPSCWAEPLSLRLDKYQLRAEHAAAAGQAEATPASKGDLGRLEQVGHPVEGQAARARRQAVRRRPLTHAAALDSWRVDGERHGGHRASETIAFVERWSLICNANGPKLR